jgi:hypothetical protein
MSTKVLWPVDHGGDEPEKLEDPPSWDRTLAGPCAGVLTTQRLTHVCGSTAYGTLPATTVIPPTQALSHRARETSNRSTLLKTGRLGIDTIAAA